MFGMPIDAADPRRRRRAADRRACAQASLATDLALTVTQRLRELGVAGEFVEFFGPGVATLCAPASARSSPTWRPEYGATTGFFPIDERDARLPARRPAATTAQSALVEAYARRNGLWFDPEADAALHRSRRDRPRRRSACHVAGPRRPQDLAPAYAAQAPRRIGARPRAVGRRRRRRRAGAMPVAIAAITSCTNTSDPRLLIAAGLLARKARAARPHAAALGEDLAGARLAGGRALPGAQPACSTTWRRSASASSASAARPASATPGPAARDRRSRCERGASSRSRCCPATATSRAASIRSSTYAFLPRRRWWSLRPRRRRRARHHPRADRTAAEGRPCHLEDLWPTRRRSTRRLARALDPATSREPMRTPSREPAVAALEAPDTARFPWDRGLDRICAARPSSHFEPSAASSAAIGATRCSSSGDDITTDHISPASAIPARQRRRPLPGRARRRTRTTSTSSPPAAATGR